MRVLVLLLIFTLLLSSTGCTGKKKCKEITEEASFTEIVVEKIPVRVNYSGPIKDMQVRRNIVEVPLEYTVSDLSSGKRRSFEINETGYYSDSARRDQQVTGYATLRVTNEDNVGGNFTVNWSYRKNNWTINRLESRLIEAGKYKTFRLEVNMSRDKKWNFGYKIEPGTKEINRPYVVYETLNESGERVIFRYNRTLRTVLRNVTRTVC